MLPAGHRLRASADFSAALRSRAGAAGRLGALRAGSRLLVVHVNSTDARVGLPPRVGFVVSKAVGGAVVRNRTKRRLRALMAARLSLLPTGTDLVVRTNPATATATSGELAADLDGLLTRTLARLGQRHAETVR